MCCSDNTCEIKFGLQLFGIAFQISILGGTIASFSNRLVNEMDTSGIAFGCACGLLVLFNVVHCVVIFMLGCQRKRLNKCYQRVHNSTVCSVTPLFSVSLYHNNNVSQYVLVLFKSISAGVILCSLYGIHHWHGLVIAYGIGFLIDFLGIFMKSCMKCCDKCEAWSGNEAFREQCGGTGNPSDGQAISLTVRSPKIAVDNQTDSDEPKDPNNIEMSS